MPNSNYGNNSQAPAFILNKALLFRTDRIATMSEKVFTIGFY